MDRNFLERVNAQKLQSSVQCSGQIQLLVDDGHHEVNGDRNPDLSLHRIGAGSEVMLDAQVAFDPAEEQFDLPSQPVDLRHGQCRDLQMIGQKDERVFPFGVEVANPSQETRECISCFGQSWFADLIASQSRLGVDRPRMLAREAQVVLGTRDEESSGTGDPIQSLEVHVAAIHHVESAGVEEQFVEPENIVLSCAGDVNAGRNRAPQIELGVHLDSRFGSAKVGPWEKGQREVDGGRVQGIDSVFQFQTKVFSGIERSGLAHEAFGQILPQSPVPLFVGVGQRRFGDRLAKAQVVERLGLGVQTCRDVAQPLAPSQLSEGHADELLPTAEMLHPRLGIVAANQTFEGFPMNEVENLRENVAAGIHSPTSCNGNSRSSNPSQPFCFAIASS